MVKVTAFIGGIYVVQAYLCVRNCLAINTRHIELEQEVLDRAVVHLQGGGCAVVAGGRTVCNIDVMCRDEREPSTALRGYRIRHILKIKLSEVRKLPSKALLSFLDNYFVFACESINIHYEQV